VCAEDYAVRAGPDPQDEVTILYARERDHSVARPELGHAERRLLRADHAYMDVVQDW
jgi:hypothetical protein